MQEPEAVVPELDADGNPIVPVVPEPETVTVPKEDFEVMKKRLDSFDLRLTPQAAPVAPQVPAGPTLDEQVAKFDERILTLGTEIDTAITEQRPVAALMSKRDAINAEKNSLIIRTQHIEPAFAQGVQTIGQLTDEVTKTQMPHLAIPEVKVEYDRFLATLPPEQTMNPQMRTYAYNMAVGSNHTVILEQQKEVWLRESTPPGGQIPGDQTGRQHQQGTNKIPKPEDILTQGNLNALAASNRTVDSHYQSLGYTDWEDYWIQTGADHYGYEKEEEK